MKIQKHALLLPILCICSMGFADQVVLKNGDRITGTVVKADGKTLVLHTEAAGDVTIQFPAILEITSAQPLHVGLSTGENVVGSVKTADGKLIVSTADKGAVATSIASLATLRDEKEEAAYEKSLHPRLTEGWAGGVNVGFGLTRGNSATKSLAVAFTGDRKTKNDHIALYTNSVYDTNDAAGASPHTTANSVQGGARYDRDIRPRLFGFGSGDFQTDALQNLDLRAVFGGGLGFHLIKSERTTLDLLAGINYTHEKYSAVTGATPPIPAISRSLAGATFGEELNHKLGKSSVLGQKLYLYPDLSETGEFRGTFSLGVVTKINSWLGWQTAFGDIYVTNPPATKKQNDVLFTTGLNISFTH